jgi:hypothetical protein
LEKLIFGNMVVLLVYFNFSKRLVINVKQCN